MPSNDISTSASSDASSSQKIYYISPGASESSTTLNTITTIKSTTPLNPNVITRPAAGPAAVKDYSAALGNLQSHYGMGGGPSNVPILPKKKDKAAKAQGQGPAASDTAPSQAGLGGGKKKSILSRALGLK